MFSKILIANRGEIALRIIRACKEMGVQTAVVYSTADREAAYLKLADQAICNRRAPPGESYLKIDRIIAAAEIADVQGDSSGLRFSGGKRPFRGSLPKLQDRIHRPTGQRHGRLGDKVALQETGPQRPKSHRARLRRRHRRRKAGPQIAGEIGYPVIIKAAAGWRRARNAHRA